MLAKCKLKFLIASWKTLWLLIFAGYKIAVFFQMFCIIRSDFVAYAKNTDEVGALLHKFGCF